MDVPNFAEIKWETPLDWHFICDSEEIPINEESGSSAMFLAGDTQIAVYRLPDGRVFASQNMCGHRRAFILSDGILGVNSKGTPYVGCPIHHRKFALEGDRAGYTESNHFMFTIATFEAKEEDGQIFVKLPNFEEMDSILGTQRWSNSKRPKPSFLRGVGERVRPMGGNGGNTLCTETDSRLAW